MKRSEVNIKYKWNLEDIFYNVSEWEKEFAALNKDIVGILKFTGKLNNKNLALECLKMTDAVGLRLEKLYCYAQLSHDQDAVDNQANELRARAENLFVQYGSMASFVTPEFSNLEESILLSYIGDKEFADYDYYFLNIVKNKKHILSAPEEKILSLGGQVFSSFPDIFSNLSDIEMPLPTIKVDGERQKMTHGKYSLWLQNKDSEVRKKAFNGMYKSIESFIHTTCSIYSSSVAKDNFLAKVKGYSSALEKALSVNDVPTEVFDNLIKQTGLNIESVHEYMALRKKIMKTDSMHMYDLYFPMFNADLSMDYENAFDLVLAGLKPLGKEYNNLLKTASSARWIDVEETDNKRSGAYSCSVASVHPYVLLNHNGTTHDIFTIAHELGHAMHSFYSYENQPYAKADYSIFVAEIASTVNEVLLIKHLLSTTKDIELKKYLLSYYLDTFRTTLFRQTMFAEFEYGAHKMQASGKPLTVESLSKSYMKLNKKYYGSDVKHDKLIQYEWARIPHFYRNFYVYQYATGIISAVNIANDILKNGDSAVARYKLFLSAGGSKSPYEILKDCGVDLQTQNPFNVAFNEFRNTLSELTKLI